MLISPALTEYKFSEESKRVFHIAQQLAVENLHSAIFPGHLLKALLHKDLPVRDFLERAGKDIYYLEEWADIRIENYPKAVRITKDIDPDDKVFSAVQESEIIKLEINRNDIDPFCLLISLTIPGLGFTYDQLRTFPLTKEELIGLLKGDKSTTGTSARPNGKSNSSGQSIKNFCIEKNIHASEGKIQEVLGREKEIRMTLEILSRKSKANVIITGEPGVGKTTLVDGLALHIVKGKVPSNLSNAQIFQLDLAALVAGTSYKGEIEDRFRKVIREIRQEEKPILFIDEIHLLLEKNKGLTGIIDQLKPELTGGEITLIGITTSDQFRKHLESDETFSRRFEVVHLNEPDISTSSLMIRSIIPQYEAHHSLKISEDGVEEAVRLSKRYNKQRRLPDAAIDLIDRTMAGIRMMVDTTPANIEEIKELLKKSDPSGSLEDIHSLYEEIQNRISYLLINRITDFPEPSTFQSAKDLHNYITKTVKDLEGFDLAKINEIGKPDLAAVISDKTGIPIGKVQTQERDRLLNIEHYIRKRVVGQDHAISSISEAILESRSGLNKGNQPIGAFFLLGPTGTGKTELAKSLSEFLFQDENAMIRFDMSEFKEEHSAALLYGAPPGYVGYEEGGMLVNKIRSQPYSVVLFDEIEKAHPSVFDIFLQIMDEGKLHDRLGKEGDFSNAVILFTSNIGSDFIIERFGKGDVPKTNELLDIMAGYFRPEFLARLTEIVPFKPISEDMVLDIFNIHLKQLLEAIDKKGIHFTIEPEAKKFLARLGFTPRYGARPLKGVIRDKIKRPLSRMIITEEIKKGDHVQLSLDASGALQWKINNL